MSFLRGNSLKSLFCKALAGVNEAHFKVTFWDGTVCQFGDGNDFKILFKTKEALKKVILDLPLGFGEGYVNGEIVVEGNLRQVVNIGLSAFKPHKKSLQSLLNSFRFNILQRNSTRLNKRNISFHYDLGNDFFQLWLDPKMTYSCAYFQNERDTLEQAQSQKFDLCCRKLRLQPNDHLLDIGCGWGSLLIYAAKNFGVRALGITLSKEQLEYGKDQIKKEGVQDMVDLQYLDYRDLPRTNRTFDKIVSVGMFEHVGKANMRNFLEIARKALRPNGLLLLHTIGKTMDEPTNNWIKKYIFPGGHLPDLGSILKNTTSQGLNFIDCENMRMHYTKTLEKWCQHFEENESLIRSMFDDRFIRMWKFYLIGCSALFKLGRVHLFQLLFSAEVRNDLPLTREWMNKDTR